MWYDTQSKGRVDVLDGISVAVAARTVKAFLGPSGCGKSTLLRILGGLEQPRSGEVWYPQESTAHAPPIPLVLQNSALLPWRTVIGNIRLSLELLGNPNKATSEEYSRLVGLDGFEHFLPKDLSAGMQARVSIARALIGASHLVLFDEAFTELDTVTRQTLNDIFCRHVEERGLAAVIVSHDIEEAVYLADTIIVLTKRPASVEREFEIRLPRPRHQQLRRWTEFKTMCDQIRALVEDLWRS